MPLSSRAPVVATLVTTRGRSKPAQLEAARPPMVADSSGGTSTSENVASSSHDVADDVQRLMGDVLGIARGSMSDGEKILNTLSIDTQRPQGVTDFIENIAHVDSVHGGSEMDALAPPAFGCGDDWDDAFGDGLPSIPDMADSSDVFDMGVHVDESEEGKRKETQRSRKQERHNRCERRRVERKHQEFRKLIEALDLPDTTTQMYAITVAIERIEQMKPLLSACAELHCQLYRSAFETSTHARFETGDAPERIRKHIHSIRRASILLSHVGTLFRRQRHTGRVSASDDDNQLKSESSAIFCLPRSSVAEIYRDQSYTHRDQSSVWHH